MTDPQPLQNPQRIRELVQKPAPSRWQIGDLIDLEYYLAADEKEDETLLHSRDREIYLAIAPPGQGPPPARRQLIRRWLEIRKEAESSQTGQPRLLPGTLFTDTLNLAKWVVLVCGFISGAGLALSLLSYRGVEPVNVSNYVVLLIGLQMFFLLALFVGFLARRRFRRRTLSASFWGGLVYHLCRRGVKAASRRLAASRRDRFSAAFGLLKSQRSVYGNLFLLPLIVISQLFGLSFNLGALGATLAKVVTADLAFGWQTTVQIGSLLVYRLVRVIALPWSWLLPEGSGHPSLEQIENSRIILKEGIANLATADLVSWWPFLCLGLLCYGILPRLLLAMTTILRQRIALRRLDFSQAACDRLVLRMQTPLLATTQTSFCPLPAEMDTNEAAVAVEEGPRPFAEDAVVLLDEALLTRSSRDQIIQAGKNHFGLGVVEIHPLTGELRQNRQVLDLLGDRQWQKGHACVCLIQEAWQPPILEFLSFLRDLRGILPDRGKIYLLLVGKPGADTIFTPPSANDRKIWERQLKSLGDPYLGCAFPKDGG